MPFFHFLKFFSEKGCVLVSKIGIYYRGVYAKTGKMQSRTKIGETLLASIQTQLLNLKP